MFLFSTEAVISCTLNYIKNNKAAECHNTWLLIAHWLFHSALQLYRRLLIQYLHVWSAQSAMLVWRCKLTHTHKILIKLRFGCDSVDAFHDIISVFCTFNNITFSPFYHIIIFYTVSLFDNSVVPVQDVPVALNNFTLHFLESSSRSDERLSRKLDRQKLLPF